MYDRGKMRKFLLVFLLFFLLLFSNNAFAKIGVGVNSGKIQVDQKLKSGMIYRLPTITVINTGTEASDYEVSVAFHQRQPELRPNAGWFIFSPKRFYLEPGKTQLVEMKINLPLITEPGNYFAYLQASPAKKSNSSGTTIGVAAATKLYFTIVQANFFLGIYYNIASFFQVYSPWPQRFTIILVFIIILLLAKKFLNIQINLKKSGDDSLSMRQQSRRKHLLQRQKMKIKKDE